VRLVAPGPWRIAIAAGSLVGGIIHLRLYLDTYRDVPIENLGRSFVLNAAASAVAAVVVLVVADARAVLVPLLVANGTLLGFGMSRTERGIFGFTERGWNPSPEAALSVVAEIVTAILCTVALVLAARRSSAERVAAPS
jgi:uncharacterized membrane protein